MKYVFYLKILQREKELGGSESWAINKKSWTFILIHRNTDVNNISFEWISEVMKEVASSMRNLN